MMQAKSNPVADVTIAISTRDRSDALKRCLDSLMSNHVLPSEVIIVDQSHDDKTRTLVQAYRTCPVPIFYIRHEGSGLGTSQNIAFAHAQSQVVAVIDDDCIATPDWIEVIERTFHAKNAVDGLT